MALQYCDFLREFSAANPRSVLPPAPRMPIHVPARPAARRTKIEFDRRCQRDYPDRVGHRRSDAGECRPSNRCSWVVVCRCWLVFHAPSVMIVSTPRHRSERDNSRFSPDPGRPLQGAIPWASCLSHHRRSQHPCVFAGTRVNRRRARVASDAPMHCPIVPSFGRGALCGGIPTNVERSLLGRLAG